MTLNSDDLEPWYCFALSGWFLIPSLLSIIWTYVTYNVPKQVSNNNNRRIFKIKDYKEEVRLIDDGSHKVMSYDLNSKFKTKPDWFDEDMLKRGQAFARKYYAVIIFNTYMTMFMLLGYEKSVQTMANTRKSTSVGEGGKRYLRTVHHHTNWYETDLTDKNSKGVKSIQVVNRHHIKAAKLMNAKTKEQIIQETNQIMKDENLKYRNLKKDMQKVFKANQCALESIDMEYSYSGPTMTQTELFATQWNFFGLIYMHPEKFGIDPKEDLEAFAYLWRYLGYLFGVEDEYNICSGSRQEILRKCDSVLEFIMKPVMKDATDHWEHMAICLGDGVNTYSYILPTETALATLLYVLDLDFTDYYSQLSFVHKLCFYLIMFAFYGQRYSWIRNIFNSLARYIIMSSCKQFVREGETTLVM